MMVYHMLHQRYGEELFWSTMSELYSDYLFQRASWTDFIRAFEEKSGDRLDWYEQQWVHRPGAPELQLDNVLSQRIDDGKHMIEFDIRQIQTTSPYRLDIPLQVGFSGDSVATHVLHDVHGKMYHARIEVASAPEWIWLDPQYDLFRVLPVEESPATLAGFFAEEEPLVVLPDGDDALSQAYREFAEALMSRSEATYVKRAEFSGMEAERAVLFLGSDPAIDRADGELSLASTVPGVAVVAAHRDGENPGIIHLSVRADSPQALEKLPRKLPHYGKYSYLGFVSGNNAGKGQWKVETSPLRHAWER